MSKFMIFVDTRVADYQTLMAGLPTDSEIMLIDGGNGLQQMADALVGRSGIDAIHILSHGSARALQLGDTLLSSANLNTYASELATIGQSLSSDGDLLLYGCNVGTGAVGQSFVESIARMTQADVAVSDDVTGSSAQGGNWKLEIRQGLIESQELHLADYNGVLAGYTNVNFTTATSSPINGAIRAGDSGSSPVSGITIAFSSNNTGGEAPYYFSATTVFDLGNTKLGISFPNPNQFDYLRLYAGNDASDFSISSFDVYNPGEFEITLSITGYAEAFTTTTALATENSKTAAAAGWSTVNLTGFTGISSLNIDFSDNTPLYFNQFYIQQAAPAPTITSATYDASSNALAVTGTNLTSGSAVDATKLTLTGEGGNTYTLTTTGVTASSTTAFSITLNATDRINVEGLLNLDGTNAVEATTYNLAAVSGWHTTGVADATNAITVSNVQMPVIYGASYDAATGVFTGEGNNFVRVTGANNDITATKLTITGEGGGTYTLTADTSNVEITSYGFFTLTLGATDKAAVNQLINKDGQSSNGGATYNLSAADDWNSVITGGDIKDLTSPIIASNTTPSNIAPTVTTPTAITFTDTTANDTFTGTVNLSGILSANDPDTDEIASYGISTPTSSAANFLDSGITYDISKTGTYGTLYVVSTGPDKGKYTYVPNATAINEAATGATPSETFTVTATDNNPSPATGNATLTVNVTGANEAPTDIALSASSVSTYSSTNTTVGTLSVTDVDGGGPTYSIVSVNNHTSGATFDLFNLDGNVLGVNNPSITPIDTYAVVIHVNDGTSDFEKSINVVVSDTMEVTTEINTQDDEVVTGTYATELADGAGLSLWEALALASAGNKTIGFVAGLAGETVTLNNDVTVPAGTVLDTDTAGTLTIGTLDINNKTLTVSGMTLHNGAGDVLNFNNVIAGTVGITKTGAGVMQLGTQPNSYVGTTTINGGTLKLGGNDRLNPAGQLEVATAGTLDLNGRAQAFAGLLGTGTITSSTGYGTLKPEMVVGTTSTFNGTLTGSLSLSLSEAGTLQLGGSSSNTYSENTTVSNGVLELNKTDAAIAVSGDLFVGDGTGTAASAVVKWLQNDQMAASKN